MDFNIQRINEIKSFVKDTNNNFPLIQYIQKLPHQKN